MIAVLPLLLYPLLGMSFVQIAQFMQEHASRVLIVGWTDVPGLPSLVDDDHFAPPWLDKKIDSNLLKVDRKQADELPAADSHVPIVDQSIHWMKTADYDVVVYFPPDFSERLKRFRDELLRRGDRPGGTAMPSPEIPTPEIYWNSTKEKSQIAFNRVSQVVERWEEATARQTLKDSNVPASAAQPFKFSNKDVAEPSQREAALWSKILPFVLLIWALTGAFYPAIDLCAGEKERGTLETLLSSPAERSEIVAGKMLTVMLFSMATSLLNLASMGFTGFLVMNRMGSLGKVLGAGLGMPPFSAVVWMLVALVPVSALFSALCIALAVVARSTKEGQYYLMPLVMVTMPLLILPMAPGVELTLGTSLVPLTGLVLLLRMLLEGEWRAVLWPPMFLPVVAVTGTCCYIAVRWAIDQFNKESVLFRESERLDLRLWLKHTIRNRGATPTASAAVACGLLILIGQFFVGLLMSMPLQMEFSDAVSLVVVSMLTIVVPTALMTGFFTRNPAKTLLIRRTGWRTIVAAIALAFTIHPLALAMNSVWQTLYPPGKSVEAFGKLFEVLINKAPYWWLPPLIMGLLPAVCEEFTFRGFILSGLRHSGHKWRAILLSALFFAVTHQLLQQSISAFIIGTMLAFVAVQTGSIWPGLLIHLFHNSLLWLESALQGDVSANPDRYPTITRIVEWFNLHTKIASTIEWSVLVIAALATMWILTWFSRLLYQRTEEETVEEAIAQEAADAVHA
jgi:sodium transport system permease protein